jgi:broad specificity phosphatase PhoE
VTIHLARHAHAGKRSEWVGDDHERPLSPRGRDQATSLIAALADRSVRRIVSSSAIRCLQTVEPLANALGLNVEPDDRFVEGADPAAALAALFELDADDGLACSHGDIIPVLLRHLVAEGMEIDGDLRDQKGSVWILDTTTGRVTRGHYLPPGA